MIYSHKPQRGGRSQPTNTNNPPQDPPPPPKDKVIPPEIPDILISDSTPPVPKVCEKKEEIILPKPAKVVPKKEKKPVSVLPKPTPKPAKTKPRLSYWQRLWHKIKGFFLLMIGLCRQDPGVLYFAA